MKQSLALCLTASCIALLPAVASADSVGSCGVGSKLFEGQSGVGPQILAVTTNGSTGNQTFGITSGTLGCNPDGAVSSNWKTSMFIDQNREKLARDMSAGGGETLASLEHLLGVQEQDRAAFARVAKNNVERIFPSDAVSTEQVMVALRQALAGDAALSRYRAAL